MISYWWLIVTDILSHTVSKLLQLIVQISDTLRFQVRFWWLRDNLRCSSSAHWKACSGLPIDVNWTFFARCYGRVATSEKRSKIGDFAPTRSLWFKISGPHLSEEWLVGATPYTWNFGSTGPHWSKFADFEPIIARSASAVTTSEKSSINANRKSTTCFPMSLRWSSYVAPRPPKGFSKTQNGRFP